MSLLFDKDTFIVVPSPDGKRSRIIADVGNDLLPLVVAFLDATSQAARLYNQQIRVARASEFARYLRKSAKMEQALVP